MKEYNELLFEAMCHAASGILANPQQINLDYPAVAKEAIVAGKEIVKQYQAEVEKDDYVTDDGMRLDIGDKYYQVIYHFEKFKVVNQTLEKGDCPFSKIKGNSSSNATLKAVNYPVTEAIYGSKELAETVCSSRNEFLEAGLIKNDTKLHPIVKPD